MSFYKAKKAFKENTARLISPHLDPATYNVNVGLYQLVQVLESEISDLHAEIAHVSQQVAQLQKR